MGDKRKPKTRKEVARPKVILIDDSEKDFSIIKGILERSSCNLLLSFSEVQKLISNYVAYRVVDKEHACLFQSFVLDQIKDYLADKDIIWILDVCWARKPNEPYPDRFGIDFMREFKPCKPILISLAPSDGFAHQIVGVKFVCKSNNAGEFLTNQFENELNKAVSFFCSNPIDE